MHTALANALLALAYFILAAGVSLLQPVSQNALMMWPSAGLAIGALILWGPRLLPGLFVGGMTANLCTSYLLYGSLQWLPNAPIALLVGLATCLQGFGGLMLIKWSLGTEVNLLKASAITRLIIISALITPLIGAIWSPTAIFLLTEQTKSNWGENILFWYLGDMIGTLVVLPMMLLLFANVNRPFLNHQRKLLLPLLACIIIILIIFVNARRDNVHAIKAAIHNQLSLTADEVKLHLRSAESVTESIGSFIDISETLSYQKFVSFAQQVLSKNKYIQSLAYIPKVQDRQAMLRDAKQQGMQNFSITERRNQQLLDAKARDTYFPVYFIYPMKGNEKAHGFDLGSNAARLAAIKAMYHSKQPTITEPIQLVQARKTEVSLLMFAPLNGKHKGLVSSVINSSALFASLEQHLQGQAQFTISDVASKKVIFSFKQASVKPSSYTGQIEFTIGGRQWRLDSLPSVSFVSNYHTAESTLILILGFGFCGILAFIIIFIQSQHAVIAHEVARKTQQLARSEQQLTTILNSAEEGVIVINLQGEIIFANHAVTKLLGFETKELLGFNFSRLIYHRHDNGKLRVQAASLLTKALSENVVIDSHEDVLWNKQNQALWVKMGFAPIEFSLNQPGLVIFFSNISKQREHQAQLYRLAYQDPLTKLANRKSFFESLHEKINQQSADKSLTICVIDLDNFKQVNDAFGHSIGDELLKLIAIRLETLLGSYNHIARLGGDEFALLITDFKNTDKLVSFLHNIILLIQQPLRIDSFDLTISISMGAVIFDSQTPVPARDLVKYADIAMYKAKNLGKSRFVIFDEKMKDDVIYKNDVTLSIKPALENKEFYLAYQPILANDGLTVAGCEVLIRWHSARLGNVSPALFIPLAEESGLINEIGQWVIEELGRDLNALYLQYRAPLYFSLNISMNQFEHNNLLEAIYRLLVQQPRLVNQLVIEVTETVMIDNVTTTIAMMNKLASFGVKFSLDDFGTGYSSLQYIKLMPLEYLKIDKIFVDDIVDDLNSIALVQASLELARGFGLSVIAEGIEQQAQFDKLKSMGCPFYQGFYFSKPLPMQSLLAFLQSSSQ